MKILTIGDIHGDERWHKFVKEHDAEYDKVILMGDYFDPYTRNHTDDEMIDNFLRIKAYVYNSDGKAIALVGNHDIKYLFNNDVDHCRTRQKIMDYFDQENPFKKYVEEGFFQLTRKIGDIWFSHAGISDDWLTNNQLTLDEHEINKYLIDCVKENKDHPFQYWQGDLSGYGEHSRQSPCWIRPYTLRWHSPEGIKQIVGHSQTEYNTRRKIDEEYPLETVNITDTILMRNTFHVVDTDKLTIKEILIDGSDN